MNVVSLCSGVGLIDLGLEWAGLKTIQLCELDRYATGILEQRYPGVPIHDDVWTIEPKECDVIAAGFPCQPFSVAGKRLGSNDPRHLWPAIWKAIATARPRYVILENVPGITAWHAAPRTGDTCVCGWSDRRRGLRLHREVTHPRTRSTSRRGNVESRPGSPQVAPLVRRNGKDIPASDGNMGGSVHVDGDRVGSITVPLHGVAISAAQATAGGTRFAVSGDPRVTGPGWWAPCELDGGSSSKVRHAAATYPRSEQEGTTGRGTSWRRVCSACGRRMGGPTIEFVRRSGIGEVLGNLAAIGFDAEWTCFNASDVGAPHKRRRWWCVATSDPDSVRVWDESGGFFREGWGSSALAWAHGQTRPVADTDGDRCVEGLLEPTRGDERSWPGDAQRSSEHPRAVADADSVGWGRRAGEQWQGRWNEPTDSSVGINASWWSTERGLDRVAYGRPNRMDRSRCLGNGVVPQCAELIGLRIQQLDEVTP